jgi:hypothetical protein
MSLEIPPLRPFKFGRLRAKRDKRNFKLAKLLKATRVPAAYDFDSTHPGIPTPMFGNEQYGDCVMAGRAHQTLRFEMAEQNVLLGITDQEVLNEYFNETGGGDTGLYVLDSIKLWRTAGWTAGGGQYKILAFAQVNYTSETEVKHAIYLNCGMGIGMWLPDSAIPQFVRGQRWSVTRGPDSLPNRANGHYVHLTGYDRHGVTCVTWGEKQQMTWGFLAKYTEEAYALIDAVDALKQERGLDTEKLAGLLDKVSK